MRSLDFCSPYRHGFLRAAASTLRTSIADARGNAESVLRVARECQDEGVDLVVFPELTLTWAGALTAWATRCRITTSTAVCRRP